MQRHESNILTSVAYPPTLAYAPPSAAMINICVNMVVYLFISGGMIPYLPPYAAIITWILAHMYLARKASIEPHFMAIHDAKRQRARTAAIDAKNGRPVSTGDDTWNRVRSYLPAFLTGIQRADRLNARTINLVAAEGRKYVP